MMQAYSPHPGVQQHPGVPQGHPMAGNIQHNPGQPGMPQGMHMGVSGPGGPQVSQAGAMMAGMPPGAGPSAHALQHLNPGQAQQAQMFQQQQLAFANNPQMAHLQQQQIMQQQRQQQAARQALMAQQYSGGGPMQVMPNGMSPMNAAQFAAMRGAPMARPVNLPQHLQHAQQQAQQQNLHEQQQAQQQAQHQQQMMAHQLAMQQQQNAQQGGNNPQGQPQMNPQQLQNMQHAQIAAAQQQQQQQQAQAAAQQSQQNQPQPQPQQPQQNPQTQPQQQPQPQMQQNAGMQQQQQAAAQAAAMLQQQRQVGLQGAMQQGEKLKGQCLIKLMLFGDYLSGFALQKGQDDPLKYWFTFVDKFFASGGVFRHSVLIVESGAETSIKQYEITFPALARYFHTHFEGGIKNMQMIVEKATEKQLPNNAHFIESQKASFVYWFDSGSQLIANGTLRALFDDQQKLELLEFVTSSHEEYLPRSKIIDAARPLHEWQKEWHKVNPPSDGKSSPEMNKKGKTKPMKSPAQPPPEIDLPASKIKPSMGITPSVFRFLELAEVIGQMNPLFHYSHLHPNFGPNRALDEYVATNCTVPNMQNPTGPRTPGMANFPIGASPAMQQLNLPDGSPHMGSPAQSQNMQLQQSQQGTVSSGPSANTSPNASNKRRRPSTVKEEGEGMVNGAGGAKSNVKPSPRIGGKRQKGNPA